MVVCMCRFLFDEHKQQLNLQHNYSRDCFIIFISLSLSLLNLFLSTVIVGTINTFTKYLFGYLNESFFFNPQSTCSIYGYIKRCVVIICIDIQHLRVCVWGFFSAARTIYAPFLVPPILFTAILRRRKNQLTAQFSRAKIEFSHMC